MVLARNISILGEAKVVNEKDVVLASVLVKEKGVSLAAKNKLTSIIYAKIFDVVGFNKNIPLYASLFFHSLTTVLLFFLVLRLFNIRLALAFSIINIFSPIISITAIKSGYYEFAVFFFAIALLIYFY